MAALNHLFGSCACERNQYTVVIPDTPSASLAHVYFDNTALSRRTQATPTTAWLRVPLEWYSSFTIAQFPDESHSSIKRTFHAPARSTALPATRRQFCGYCGSHLTQWNEGEASQNTHELLDVTLGSLLDESLEKLEALNILDPEAEQESDTSEDGLVKGTSINEEDHIATNEQSMGGVDAAPARPRHQLANRGMPYFEEMVENSRLGRLRRRAGGHASADGTTRVQWEVLEVGNWNDSEPMEDVASGNINKRQKLGS
ncbi:hypothetical protein DOTSEDRAFT_70635 [Lecanosticta acicola]|uniref:CENP-V/GFA domain-containing protein n=1 Tax=Lecanosticta acicola TaxID=111012 RepID=A0AAI8W1Y6_9PEZI|nr:hypothetical protein DOTSEDRAFT_70635 [Lecanosticta acicola]